MSSDRPSDGPSAAPELLDALASHSQRARDHGDSTATYVFAIAAELGLSRDECERVREAARLHEVGLVYSANDDLGTHQEETYRLVRGAGVDDTVSGWLLRTRERFDGRGPEGLAADAIPIESRLIRVACAFHAALLEPGSSPETAIAGLGLQAGAELDPQVVAALAAVLRRI